LKRKINWAIPGLLAMLLIIGGLAWLQSLSAISPDPAKLATQCSACHDMGDHVTSWQQSSHKDVACTDCHADPGVRGWIEMQIGHIRMLSASGDEPADLSQVATEVPNARCIACHAQEMPWVMQDLEPPQFDENGEPIRVSDEELEHFPALAGHDLHLTLDQPLNCTDCHAGASHGPAERVDQVKTWHDTCLQCHAEEQVTMKVRTSISCSACHADLTLVSPENHKKADFRDRHGKAAANEIQSCQQCHLTPGLAQLGPGSEAPAAAHVSVDLKDHPTIPEMPAGSLAVTEGMKDACASCHGVTMPHPENWVTSHTAGFKENPALCASCHGSRDQGFDMEVLGDPRVVATNDSTCTSCHAQPMPHPADWTASLHQSQAKTAPQTCAQCHSDKNPVDPTSPHASTGYCIDCHLNQFTHPRGFVATHGSIALAPNGKDISGDCTSCHTPTVNSCTECHTDGIGKDVKQEWHPQTWVATHEKFALNSSGQISANCATCHTSTFNSCTECHTDGVGGETATKWHPDAWVANHKSTALDANGQISADCTSCHTPTFNACTDCHSAGFGQNVKQQWHPPMFWVSHSRTTKPEDIASCKSCHNYVEPKCSQCHRAY